LAPEAWSFEELVAAGWRESDLEGEMASESAMEALASDDFDRARSEMARAVRIATANFTAGDPRLGAALANHGAALVAAGEAHVAGRAIADALGVWRNADGFIAKMTAPRVARSSLFHLRMEQRHRGTYEARWRVKWAELVEEARGRLGSGGFSLIAAAEAAERLSRWRRERPTMLNDTRKLMAAVIVLACRPAPPG
jgi:hypothetical protein